MNFDLFLVVFQVQTLFFAVEGNEEDVLRFFTSALQCIESLQTEESNNFDQERLYRMLDDHTRTLSAYLTVSRYGEDNTDVSNLLGSLHRCFRNLLHTHETRRRTTDVTINLIPPTTL